MNFWDTGFHDYNGNLFLSLRTGLTSGQGFWAVICFHYDHRILKLKRGLIRKVSGGQWFCSTLWDHTLSLSSEILREMYLGSHDD